MLDIVFENINIIDGTGKKAYVGNVGVKAGKVLLKPVEESKKVIDGRNLTITPGFIDAHSHGDGSYGEDFASESKVSQGITTEITGQCGTAMFPVVSEHADELKKMVSLMCKEVPKEYDSFTSFESYSKYVDNVGLTLNAKQLIGHGSLRIAVMGYQNRKCTDEELEAMKQAVREAMEHGALGLSSGLIYSPSCYADTEELIELCKVVSEYGGIYATHLRNESFDVVKSVKEALEIGRKANIHISISHHKVQGRPYWGNSVETLEIIHEAIEAGQKVTIDQYPYLASMTNMNAIIPPEYFGDNLKGLAAKLKDLEIRKEMRKKISDDKYPFENQFINCGGWENIQIATVPTNPEFDGKTIAEVAEILGKDEFDVVFDILAENDCQGTCIYFSMCDEDLCRILADPNTVVGTDGLYSFRGQKTHPRAWGSFPHAINYFVKEQKVLQLEAMINKITALPAERFELEGKGKIEDGMDADLVIFDYDELKDTATFKQGEAKTDGIKYVLVNGEIVYQDGELTGIKPGKLIRHHI